MKCLICILGLWVISAGGSHAQRYRELTFHLGEVNAVAFSPDGKLLATGGANRKIAIWSAADASQIAVLEGHPGPVHVLAFNPNSLSLASGDATGLLRVWEVAERKAVSSFFVPGGGLEALAFCPDGHLVATGHSGVPLLYDLADNWNTEFRRHKGIVYAAAISPDGRRLATGGQDKLLKIWDLKTGQAVLELRGHQNTIRSVAYSPDGTRLATGGLDRTVRVWNTENGAMVQALPAEPDAVRKVAFSPDGRMLATANRDGRVRIYDFRKGANLVATLEGHRAALWDMAFSPDGKKLATASADGTARLWDVAFLGIGGAMPVVFALSDDRFAPDVNIETNVPDIQVRHANRFALVIGNEFYTTYQPNLTEETNVEFARADAALFATYAEKTLGVPQRNLLVLLDGSAAQMMNEVRKLVLLANNYGTGAEIIFYYAGHGVPHPETGESLLLPVDVNANQPQMAIAVRSLLEMFGGLDNARTTLFLDACFSGLARNASPMAQRGVRIAPKAVQATGNTVVFSAAAADQPALPYRQARHGLFTWHLLKIFHQFDNLTYGFIADKIETEVALNALLLHNRKQNPVVVAAPELGDAWQGWRLSQPLAQPVQTSHDPD